MVLGIEVSRKGWFFGKTEAPKMIGNLENMACQKCPRLQFLLSQTVLVETTSFQEEKKSFPASYSPKRLKTPSPEAFTSESDCVQAHFRIVRGNYKAIYHSLADKWQRTAQPGKAFSGNPEVWQIFLAFNLKSVGPIF